MTACPSTLHPQASVFLCLVPQCMASEPYGHLILFLKKFICFWLRRLFTAACGLSLLMVLELLIAGASLVAENGLHSE